MAASQSLSSQSLCLTKTTSPIGDILLVTDETMLVSLDFAGYEQRMMRLLEKRYGAFTLAERDQASEQAAATGLQSAEQIKAYIDGDLTAIDTMAVNPGGTHFQATVWQALRSIPVGTVISYGDLARQLGNPGAVRAVGTTNSLNPISIVLPCHRVIGANGSLTGYAGGLERKQWLLSHEGLDLANLKPQKQQNGEQQLSLLAVDHPKNVV